MTRDDNSEHPLAAYVGPCRATMWMGGLPSGLCGNPAFGQFIEGQEYAEGPYRGERIDRKYNGFVTGPACPIHGGPDELGPRVFEDGKDSEGRRMWCAVYEDFEDLQASPAEFHIHAWVAVRRLTENHPRNLT